MPPFEDLKLRPYRATLASLWRPLALLAAAMALATAGMVMLLYEQELREDRYSVGAVAELRSQQLSTWLDERLQSASLHANSFPQAELWERWRNAGDSQARERLFLRLTQFARAGGFKSVTLLDASGKLLWSRHFAEDGLTPEIRARILAAAGAAAPSVFVGPYRDAHDEVHIDFVTRLPTPEPASRPVVWLHTTPKQLLSAGFREFSLQPDKGRVRLFRLDGRELLLLSEPRPGSPAERMLDRLPVEGTVFEQLADAPPERGLIRLEGIGLRGRPLQAAVSRVPGTDWWVGASIDEEASLLAALPMLLAVVALMTMLYLAVAASLVVHRQQRLLARSIEEQHAQAVRLRGMRLVAAIADSSADFVYVKDIEGRYLLLNRAASEFTGQPEEVVIGKDDYFLFPPEQAARLLETHRRVLATGCSMTVEETVDGVAGRRVIMATVGPMRDDDGRLIGVYGIARDITAHKTAAAEREHHGEVLARQNEELARFNSAMVGRELEMRRLKQEVNALARELGRVPPYSPASEHDG